MRKQTNPVACPREFQALSAELSTNVSLVEVHEADPNLHLARL
jgi:hypothetical protein